jgi:hypothetical protein
VCGECGVDLDPQWRRYSSRPPFCSVEHRTRLRDRRKYHEDPEGQRERSRNYYARNRENVLAKAKARAEAKRLERGEPVPSHCSECGEESPGRQRIVCSDRCGRARYRRLNPERYAEEERRKVERRTAKRRAARAARGEA